MQRYTVKSIFVSFYVIDFFDPEKFPTSTFTTIFITAIAFIRDPGFTHTVSGLLTINSKTDKISIDALIKT